MIDKKKVLEALQTVREPNTGQNIVSNNQVQNLKISGLDIQFSLLLPSLNISNKSELNFACISAIQSIYPNANVHVHLEADANPQKTSKVLPHIKNIIAVASGKGGVGKSTVAVNLALGLQALGAKVGIMDADLYGPSIPTMLGLQGQRPQIKDLHGQPKMLPLEAYDMPIMSIGFIIEPEQAVVLRGPRLGAIIRQFVQDCIWPSLDFLIIDLPPGTGDVQLSLVQTVPITGVVMVTTPQEVALADAIKGMNMFLLPSVNVPILGIVENMAWFTPAELPNNKYYIFGKGGGKKLAKMGQSMLLGQVPLVQEVRECGDNGKPAILEVQYKEVQEAFKKIAQNTARQIAIRNEFLSPTQKVNLNS